MEAIVMKSRIWGTLFESLRVRGRAMRALGGIAVLSALAAGCMPAAGGANHATTVTVTPEARDHVMACYRDAYGRKQGTAPTISEQDRAAADELLAKHNNESDSTCKEVTTALAGPLCNMPVSLQSVAACDRQMKRRQAAQDMNPADKAALDQRIQQQQNQQMNNSSSSY
jgi:hypothetical protein